MCCAALSTERGGISDRFRRFSIRFVASLWRASAIALLLAAPSQAVAALLTLGPGVQNAPPSLASIVPEIAIADEAALIDVNEFSPTLAAVLNAQGFTAANNWSLITGVATHAPMPGVPTINLTTYQLFLNPAQTAFGMTIAFSVNASFVIPGDPLPEGAQVSHHWLQYVNTDSKVNGFGHAIADEEGFWQMDNGQVNGGAAAGPATGPYYDSNSPPGDFSTPPNFFDEPKFYSGIGTYLHFTVIPTIDVFIPATETEPALGRIYVADFGLTWGFRIVPEPSTAAMLGSGLLVLALFVVRRRGKIAAVLVATSIRMNS